MMKRIVSFLLLISLLVVFCACGNGESTVPTVFDEPETTAQIESACFRAGFGQALITPNYPVPMSGYGNSAQRMSQGFMDYSYVSCIAVQDEAGNTALFVTMDVSGIYDAVVDRLLDVVNKATGIPREQIYLAATHTHSGPDLGSNLAVINTYKRELEDHVSQACSDALADLSPASLQTGSTYVENMTFVRHYLMNDGSYYGPNFGSNASGFKAHEREADNQMQLVRFLRAAEDKKDILLVNWQAHPVLASTTFSAEGKAGRTMLSADYIGYMRTYVREQTDCLVAYYLGASGNQNPNSFITEEQKQVPTDVKAYGKQLGQYVVDALENMKDVDAGAVKTKHMVYEGQRDHTEDHLLMAAKEVEELWLETNNTIACYELGRPMGVQSAYHAISIISRAKAGETKKMPINAISIGDVGFATVPYEMFCQNGQAIKEGSPFDTTIVITLCGGYNNYVAADAAFEYGSYEVHNRTFFRGTAEEVQDHLIAMLNELK